MLSDIPRQKLCEIITHYGESLCDDPRKFEAVLRDLCAGYRKEVHLMVSALKERVPADMLAAADVAPDVLVARLTKRLEQDLGLIQALAQWTVESWGIALGKLESEQERPLAQRPVCDEIPGLDRMLHQEATPSIDTNQLANVARPRKSKWIASAVLAAILLGAGGVIGFKKWREAQETKDMGKRLADAIIKSFEDDLAVQRNWVGKWQATMTNGSNKWICISENSPQGDYQFSAACPPPLTAEKGRFTVTKNGTWWLRSNSGRSDSGTYRFLSSDRIEMTGQLGTAVWERVKSSS